jgi:hypothetical protein
VLVGTLCSRFPLARVPQLYKQNQWTNIHPTKLTTNVGLADDGSCMFLYALTPISVCRILELSSNNTLLCFDIRFEVFTAVIMKNVVFWDIKTQFVLHRRHITSPL